MEKKLLIISVACLLIMTGCATQKDMSAIDNRISEMELRDAEARKNREQMESELSKYSQNREVKDQELRRQSASLHALIEEVREEVRILNGRLEEIEYSLNQQKKAGDGLREKSESTSNQLSQITAKNEERIARLENYLNLESAPKASSVVPAVTPAAEAKVSKELSEDEIYKSGKQAFDEGDSETAKKRFQELIDRYPKSENADNAQFWIGEIYYREKWYEKAILEYQEVIEKYPKGNKVPSALLKQGLAFQNIGDKANSRLILDELVKKYPKSNEAKIAQEKLKEIQ